MYIFMYIYIYINICRVIGGVPSVRVRERGVGGMERRLGGMERWLGGGESIHKYTSTNA